MASLRPYKQIIRGYVEFCLVQIVQIGDLNSISEITAVKPVKGRDTEMYPIEFS